MPTNFSFETFDSAYHSLERFDCLLGILTGAVSILRKIVRDCLYGAQFTLYILLGCAEDLAVVLVRNLMEGSRASREEGNETNPSKRLLKDQEAI